MLGVLLGWYPLNNQPHIYTLYSGYWVHPLLKGSNRGAEQTASGVLCLQKTLPLIGQGIQVIARFFRPFYAAVLLGDTIPGLVSG